MPRAMASSGDAPAADVEAEASYERLWNYYLEPITREKEKLPGGITLRRKRATCNLLRYKNSVFRRRLHAAVLRLSRRGRKGEVHRMLREIHDHDKSGRSGDGPAGLVEEILGRKKGDDGEVEVLDADDVAAMTLDPGGRHRCSDPAEGRGGDARAALVSPDPTRGGDPPQVQDLAWKCHNCLRLNLLRRLKCCACSSWKGRSKSSTRTSTEGCEIVRLAGAEERHDDECYVCGDGGELVCCDAPGCTRVYHGTCIGVDDPDALPDPWHCPSCGDARQAKPPLEGGTSASGAEEDEEKPSSASAKSIAREKKTKRKQNEEEDKEDATKLSKSASREKKKRKTKQEEGEEASKCNDDSCYICDNGGFLICCDHCDKAFHMKCHVPPLLELPEGDWKCCECSASDYSRRNKCGLCKECLRDDCGECTFCLDKSKFGGPNILKQVCRHKRCMWKRYAPTAAVTPEMKKELMERHERADGEGDALAEEEFMDGRKLGEMFDSASAAEDATACPGNEDNETLGNSDEAPAAAALAAAASASGGDGTDVVSVAGTQDIHNAVAGAGESGVGGDGVVDGNAHAPGDLATCQMELERARSEIARQADEIRRLKSAVRALTAVLTE